MTTITFVQHQTPELPDSKVLHLVLKTMPKNLQVLSREVFDLALDELAMIADFYRDWDTRDPLSIQLADWCIEVIDYDGYSEMLDEEFIKMMQTKIQVLTTETLVNPLDKAPLEDPILVDQSIWENWMWKDFNQIYPQPNRVSRTHSFALEIIRWKNSLPIPEMNSKIQLTHPLFNPVSAILPANTNRYLNRDLLQANNDLASQALKIFTYCQLASHSLVTQELQKLRLEMNNGAKACRRVWEISREAIDLLKAQTEKEGELHNTKLKQVMDNIQATHQSEVKILSGLINNQKTQIQETKKRLELTETRAALQESQIRALRQQYVDQQSAVETLNKKNHKKKRRFGIF